MSNDVELVISSTKYIKTQARMHLIGEAFRAPRVLIVVSCVKIKHA